MFVGLYIFIGVIVVLVAAVIIYTSLSKKADARKQNAMK
jgi:hypothetical protein